METDRYLRVSLRDKAGKWRGYLGAFTYLTVTERWHGQGSGEIEVEATNPKLPTMMEPGMRVFVEMVTGSIDTGEQLAAVSVMQGYLSDPVLGFMNEDTVRFQITDDWAYLREFLAWVRPDLPLEVSSLSDTGQSYDTVSPAIGTDTERTGYWRWSAAAPYPAETAISDFLDTHLRLRWLSEMGSHRFSIFPSAGRGGDVSTVLPQVRFGMLEDYVLPLLELSGLGMRFTTFAGGTSAGGLTNWEFWEPREHEQVFTPDSGVIVSGTASLKYPTVTDVVVGGPGDQASRHFMGVNDNTGLRELYGRFVEVFREATGAPDEWPTSLAENLRVAKYYLLRPEITADQKAAFTQFMVSAGAETLAGGAPTSGVSLEIQESKGFKYTGLPPLGEARGSGFATGDLMTVAPSDNTALSALRFTDRITSTTLTQTPDDGLTIKPVLGNTTDNPDRVLAKAVRSLFDAARRKNINQ